MRVDVLTEIEIERPAPRSGWISSPTLGLLAWCGRRSDEAATGRAGRRHARSALVLLVVVGGADLDLAVVDPGLQSGLRGSGGPVEELSTEAEAAPVAGARDRRAVE